LAFPDDQGITCQWTRTHNSRRRLRRVLLCAGHLHVMPHRSAPIWRQLGSAAGRRRSSPSKLQIDNPLKRRRSFWCRLTKPELRLLMAGLANWEQRSRGPTRARIRRKRLDAVEYYGRRFGALSTERLWAGPRTSGRALPMHNPRSENARGVLWHEA